MEYETIENPQERGFLIQFGERVDDFFNHNQDTDWVVVGMETGEFLLWGTDDTLPTEEVLNMWQQARGDEPIGLRGRTIFIDSVCP